MKSVFCYFTQCSGKLLGMMMISLLLYGCMSSDSDTKKVSVETTNYHIAVLATRDANISTNGAPAPLKINVFNLRSDSGFMNADLFSLHNNPQAALGNNLLSHEQFFLLPNKEPVNISGKSDDERYYVGITGEFQSLNHKVWRIVIPIKKPEKPPFYKFWLSIPSQQEIKVIANQQGLHVAESNNMEK
ncbi:type VI secretion system lipoprotein TssJ [Serratia sp. DD3]|uniref:type VI secretion system lipoprotein TssJ n=1 Tax=Serratia sp. DD3 TaxID=1410619 RepID=UPI0004D5D104|nr:type VI secretion system lipoprotein TssJ [Serratia sp. DD3]KEY58748.1 type VI secretion lipoprotein, family [Serratia sp. DD3]